MGGKESILGHPLSVEMTNWSCLILDTDKRIQDQLFLKCKGNHNPGKIEFTTFKSLGKKRTNKQKKIGNKEAKRHKNSKQFAETTMKEIRLPILIFETNKSKDSQIRSNCGLFLKKNVL